MSNIDKNNSHKNSEDNSSEEFFDVITIIANMFKLMKAKIVIVLAIVAIFAVSALGYSVISYEPTYKSSVTFSITPLVLSDSKSGLSVYKFNYVFSFANQINETFPHIVESNILKESISYNLGREINGKIIPEPISGSNIFKVTVESNSAKDANDIINSFIKCYPSIAEHIIGDTRIKVIHTSGMPTTPDNTTSHLLHTLLGAVIGFIFSMGVFYILALNRKTIRNKNDIITKLNSNCICEIPHINLKRGSRNTIDLIKSTSKTLAYSEAMRAMKKRIKAILHNDEKIIAVTGAMSGEGKTTVSYNLAKTLANGGERTLLIDMDLLHKTLQNSLLKNPQKCIGITDVVNDKSTLDKAICNISENFDVLFAGSSECKFNNHGFEDLFNQLREQYDYIIIDTPPCGIVSDSALITNLCDVIIFTIKSDYTSVNNIKSALRYILYSKARLLGFVINDSDSASSLYGNYSYYDNYRRYDNNYRNSYQ